MKGWSSGPVAIFTGLWSFSSLPGAALDAKNENLLIVWADASHKLNLLQTKPTDVNKIYVPTTIDVGGAFGSPSAAYLADSFYVFWRAVSGQLLYGTYKDNVFTNRGFLLGANSADGPQVTVSGNKIWVAWRGLRTSAQVNDESLYFSTLEAPDKWSTSFLQGGAALNSVHSPAIGFLSNPQAQAVLCTVYTGAEGNAELWNAYQSGDSFEHAVIPSFDSSNRPSLAVSPAFVGGTALIVFQISGTLRSSTSVFQGGKFGPWGSLAAIVKPELTLPTPMGVLVTQAGPSSPVYLLLGDITNGFNNVLYLYQYTW